MVLAETFCTLDERLQFSAALSHLIVVESSKILMDCIQNIAGIRPLIC
jgi:hypothetical protein